jgi:hypothetical protein
MEINEKTSTMKILIELHDMVKNHPYRLSGDEKYERSYIDLLHNLSSVAYCEIRKYCEKNGIKNGIGMFHDFNASMYNLKRSERIQHIERCIMVIHRFIDTGVFDEYYTYYYGCNIEDGVNRLRKYVLNKENNKFEGIYTLKELDIMITSYDKDIEYYAEKATMELNEKGFYHNMLSDYKKYQQWYIDRKRKMEEIEENKRKQEIERG